ncbi:MAG: hypothetical protein RLZZ58_1263 [Pseudomonadota bacterium]
MIRPIFVSHGAPTLPFEDVAARHFLRGLAATMPRPRAILAVSAHWETRVPTVNSVAFNTTIHDFSGFPAALYQLTYPAPGDPALAARVVELVGDAGLAASTDGVRGLDHGAWVPLMLAWPEADIPVVQLSVQSQLGPGHHLELGRALAPLAHEDVLILGSGSFTHDLSSWRGQNGAAEPDWVTGFAEWMDAALTEGRTCDLLAYRRLAPHAVRNHPTEEHLLPLYVTLGAAGPDLTATRLHASNTYGVLRMDAYTFGG